MPIHLFCTVPSGDSISVSFWLGSRPILPWDFSYRIPSSDGFASVSAREIITKEESLLIPPTFTPVTDDPKAVAMFVAIVAVEIIVDWIDVVIDAIVFVESTVRVAVSAYTAEGTVRMTLNERASGRYFVLPSPTLYVP